MIETSQPNVPKQTPGSFLKLMSISVQKLSLPKTTIYYSFGKKVSNSGFFNNDRFLLLNSAERTFQYFSKAPKGLPLMNQSQILQLGKPKAIVNLKQATSVICEPLGMKISTMVLQYEERGKKDKWIFEFSSSKMMHQWMDLINITRKGQKPPQLPKNSPINKAQQPPKTPMDNTPLNKAQQSPKKPVENTPINKLNNPQNKQDTKPIPEPPKASQNKSITKPIASQKPDSRINNQQQPMRETPSFLIPPPKSQTNNQKPNNSINQNPNYNNTFQQSFGSNIMPGGRANQTQPLEKTNNNMSNSRPKSDYPLKNQPDSIRQQQDRRQRQQIRRRQEERLEKMRIQAINNTSSRPNFRNHPQSGRSNNLQIPHDSFDNMSNRDSRMLEHPSHENKRIFSQQQKNYSTSSLGKMKSNIQWNHQWCNCGPTRQLQLYQRFVNRCQQINREIIDQIPFKKRDRQHSPLDSNPPFNIYKNDGIVFIVHIYSSEMMKESSQYNFNAPLLYDEETYEQLKREFENYNLILSVTGNQKFVKVPLSCYIQYKGILSYCKAEIPFQYRQVDPLSFEDQFQVIQALVKVKFPLSDFCCFEEPRGQYILLNDLATLVPKIPTQNNLNGYFCKQFLLNWEQQNLYYKSAVMDAHNFILKNSIAQFLQRIQSLQSWVCCSKDLVRQLNYDGISECYITDIYRKTSCSHLKKILVSQLVSKLFMGILISELNTLYQNFPVDRFQKCNIDIVNNLIIEAAHSLIDEMFSYTLKAQNIWKVIVNEINKKYKLVISKEDIIPGYILSALSDKMGITFDFKCPQFDRKQNFFVGEKLIPRAMLIKFIPKITRYNSSFISPQHQQIRKILDQPPTIQGFNRIVALLDLQNKQIESSAYQLMDPINLYLANFIPFDDTRQFDHLDIYQQILRQPHTYYTMKVSLLAIKWSIKRKNLEIAYKIFEDKCQQNSFWLGQFNAPVSEFYDFFSMYYASIGNYDEAVKLGKSSLVNVIKILSTTSLSTADKHYQLGNIYFKMGKKQQALKQYSKTKNILNSHEQKNIPQYGVILLKMSLLYLNFGKIKDCVMNSFEALKIFDGNGGSEKDEIQIYQILIRAYEITRQTADMMNVGAICSQKFNTTEDPIIFERMAKIVIYPKLCSIGTQQSKNLQNIIFKLQELDSEITSIQSFAFLHKIAINQNKPVMKKILQHIDNIVPLSQQIKRKDFLRKHKSLVLVESKNEPVQFLVLLQALCQILGYGFVLGSLRENYYD